MMKFSPKFIQKVDFYANFFWLLETLGNFVSDLLEYSRLSRDLKDLKNRLKKIENSESDEIKYIRENEAKLKYILCKKQLDLWRCILDFPVNKYIIKIR